MSNVRVPIEEVVRKIIEQELHLAEHGYELGDDDSLWDMGMTSLTCLGLLLNLEDTLDIELPEHLLKESTFHSVNSIVTAVQDVLHARREDGAPVGG